MSLEFVNPTNSPAPAGGYSNLAVIPPDRRLLVIAGQIGNLMDGSIVEGLEAQFDQALANINSIVSSQGGYSSDVARVTVFLVEKPIFHSVFDLKIASNEVYVGYNLRFHPMLNKIKTVCEGKDIWTMNVFCGSFLPDWRPDRDYRESYSAKKESGGGVLLDLSHELDYIQWLAGPLEIDYVVNGKISNLAITSDDYFSFSGRGQYDTYININLNYFTRKPIRRIIIDGQDISIQADLIENNLNIIEDGKELHFSWSDHNINDTYEAQHQAVINGDLNNICTYKEGLRIINLIKKIQEMNKNLYK